MESSSTAAVQPPATTGNEENPFEAMMQRFDHAAELLELDPGIYRILRNPEKQIITSIPVAMDNGEVEVFQGYRVLYNTSRGPAKGGIRFDMGVSLDEVTALAAWMRHVRGDARPVDDPMANDLRSLWRDAGRSGIAAALFGPGGLFARYWQADEPGLAALTERLG